MILAFCRQPRARSTEDNIVALAVPISSVSTVKASDADGTQVRLQVPIPSMQDRQVLAAEDPLATAHHFQIVVRVVVPSFFGFGCA